MNKKVLLIMVLMLSLTFTFAQDEKEEELKDGWTKGGNIAITFNQSAFNNEWIGGGISNIAANILINYDFNFKKGDLIWDNKIITDYGAFKNKGQDVFTKSNDRLEFNSLVGKKAKGYWYYSAYFNLRTQLDTGYLFGDDGLTRLTTISHFFSPAFLQTGPGMLWKKSENLKVNFSPVAAKMIIVHDEFAGSFGTDIGETSAFELGVAIQGYYKVDLMKNISMENLLNLYTNYLKDPKNVDVDYTMNLVMAVNKYISANLTFQAIYDDNSQRNGFQIRETFGVGLNFKL
ncbi:MAG: DUF3078 domain-containing protein [Flavobacteriaceae bacterium]|nr:DUF3078 domain-containing protein [Flavobacteriaceae bacterium]